MKIFLNFRESIKCLLKHVLSSKWCLDKCCFKENLCYLRIDKSTEMIRLCNTVFLVSLVKKCPSKAFLQLWLHTDIFLCSKEHSRGFQIDLHFDKTHSDLHHCIEMAKLNLYLFTQLSLYLQTDYLLAFNNTTSRNLQNQPLINIL